ncbi:MAG: hypothetical protein LH630_00070 [Actinomycetia bacterium]|nr:hypothetical protein [Actinomycetes bacterium]
MNSIVLSVQVSDVARGALPEGSNGTIYVVIPMASLPLNEYESALPVGEDTVLYLNEDRSPDSYYRDPSVGRPGKQPLWVLASPQGFVVEQGDTSVQIFDTQKFSGTVDEFLPTSDSFPEPSKGTEQTG